MAARSKPRAFPPDVTSSRGIEMRFFCQTHDWQEHGNWAALVQKCLVNHGRKGTSTDFRNCGIADLWRPIFGRNGIWQKMLLRALARGNSATRDLTGRRYKTYPDRSRGRSHVQVSKDNGGG